MGTAATTRLFRSGMTIVAIVVLAGASGCVGVGQQLENWCYGLSIRSQQHHELADVRQDTRVALAEQEREALRMQAEREVEQARLDAERQQLEMEFCRANQEALQQQLKRNIRQTVESKVAFNVEQGLEVGELEVDVEALQKVLQQREQEAQRKPPEQEAQRKGPCPCCDQPCGCEPGMIRRFCPRCRNKPCEAERDCGGPEALRRLEQQPVKRPLKPVEIPMKLPVRLNFGLQQPEMEAARIRRVPELPQEAVKRPCDRCTEPNGYCPMPCTKSAAPQAPSAVLDRIYEYQSPIQPTVPTAEPQIGPLPVPDAEARRLRDGAAHGIRLGMAPYAPNDFAWTMP